MDKTDSSSDHPHGITLMINSDLKNTVFVAMAVRGLCALTSFTEQEINRIELCVVEVVNNAIEHAYAYKAGNDIKVDVWLSPENIFHIKVTDYGKNSGKAFVSPQEKTLAVDADDVGSLQCSGRGLAIIEKIMDGVHYHSENGNNSVSMWRAFSGK